MTQPNKNYWVTSAFNHLVNDYREALKNHNPEKNWIEHKLIGWAIQHVDLSQLKLISHDRTSN